VSRVKQLLAETPATQREWAAAYVDALILPLLEAKLGISGRRAVHLAKGIHAIHAAASVLGLDAGCVDAAFLALKYGLPQRAQGRQLDEAKLKAIHRAALGTAGMPADSPWHKLSAIADPVRRIAAALPHYPAALDRSEISALVSDAYAGLTVPRRYLLARHLLPLASRTGCLNVPTFELLSEPARKVRQFVEAGQQNLIMERSRAARWDALIAAIGKARKTSADGDELGNYLLALRVVEKQEFEPGELIDLDRHWGRLLASVSAESEEAAA